MKIGARMRSEWMNLEDENNLKFLRQIGIEYVDAHLTMIDGYRETGVFTREALFKVVDRLAAAGLRIQRASGFVPHFLDAHLGRPEGERQLDNICRIVELLGEAEIPVFGLQPFSATMLVKQDRPGWSRPKPTRRGGYEHPHFDLAVAERLEYQPTATTTVEQLWDNLLRIYRQVLPVAESAGVKIANHGIDPPLPYAFGNPQILCSFADFDRLFSEAPSPNNGMTFCVGTRYESGEDVFEGIRHFGKQGKIFHVHFRNVIGTLPSTRRYSEVFLDEGDMDMSAVARALRDAGFDGVLDYDHVMDITGDGPDRRQYIAYAVGYIRGTLQALGISS